MWLSRSLLVVTAALAAGLALTTAHGAEITPAETKAIAEDGFIYGLPIEMNYAVNNYG